VRRLIAQGRGEVYPDDDATIPVYYTYKCWECGRVSDNHRGEQQARKDLNNHLRSHDRGVARTK
jgi:hypothetical protein